MRRPEQFPDDPEIVATLEAIDATLAGEAIDPRQAEWAELALMLAAERPAIDPAFAAVLDEGVRRRAATHSRARRSARWWVWAPATAMAASLAVAVVIVVGQGSVGGGVLTTDRGTAASAAGVAGAAGSRGVGSAAGNGVKAAAAHPAMHSHSAGTAGSAPLTRVAAGTLQTNSGVQSVTPRESVSPSAAGVPAPRSAAGVPAPSTPRTLSLTVAPVNGAAQPLSPPTAGRKVVQGAQLSLSTSSRRVDQVAQEVFDVVGQQSGIVKNSSVTASGGRGGYAQFQLSVPSANLAQTMSALSNLSFAQVVSRTDTSQDVTNQFDVDQRNLNDARALRTSLLKQLASAVTQAQIDSLTLRIRDAESAITADENTVHSLERQVGYSQIFVSINAGALPVVVAQGGTRFGLGKAAHDAGRVLTVAAGVALIGLAALLPVGLVLALLWWIYATVRRRRRLQALDVN